MSPYAKRISNTAWEEHRDFIRLRYLVNGKSLKNVCDDLSVQKGFSVTPSQLENRCKKWGFRKYLDRATWQRISSLQSAMNHEEPIFVKGKHFSRRKIAKEMRRRKLLQCSTSSLSPLIRTALAPVDLPLSMSSATNGVVLCPSTFAHQDNPGGPWSSNEKHRVAVFGQLDAQERASLLSKIINKAIDNFDKPKGGPCVRPTDQLQVFSDLLDVVTGVIKLASDAALRPASFNCTDTRVFQATISRLWYLILEESDRIYGWDRMSYESYLHERSPRGCDHDEDQLHSIVNWILVVFTDHSSLFPTIDDAFDCQLRYGNMQVSLLLWPWAKHAWALYWVWEPSDLRHLVTLRTKAASLLRREMISTVSAASLQLILRSSAEYATTDDFKDLYVFCASRQENVYDICSSAVISSIFEGCVYTESEDSAVEKLQFYIGELGKLGLQLQPSHVKSTTFFRAAEHGSFRLLEILMTINPCLPTRDRHGFSALTIAADYGHLDLCRWILQHDSDHDIDSILLALFVALAQENFEICQFLEPRFLAMCQRQLSAMEWRTLLCSCSSTSATSRDGALQTFTVGHVEIRLRQHRRTSAWPFCVVCNGAWRASAEGDFSGLQFCLDHGASVPPIRSALCTGAGDYLCFLNVTLSCSLETGCSFPTGSDTAGSFSARMKCVELLIGQTGTPKHSDIAASLFAGEWTMTEILLDRGFIIEKPGELLEAAIRGQRHDCIVGIYQVVGSLYHPGALCASIAFSSGDTLVRDIALEIVSRRAPDNLGSQVESTAIAIAALQDDIELFRKLLSAIPSPHPVALVGTIQTQEISLQKVLSMVRTAIRKYPAQIWDRADGVPLLGLASICDRPSFTSDLLEYGLQPDLQACSMAAAVGSRRSLQVLLQGRSPLYEWTQGHGARTQPLDAAIASWKLYRSDPDFSIISQLLSAGASINYNDGSTCLWSLVESDDNLQLASFLIDHGADVNARCESCARPTALYEAIYRDRSAGMVELLVSRGADVNAPPSVSQFTCLQMVVHRYDMLEILISRGVEVDGDFRLDYIIAVFEAERYDSYPLAALRLKEYGRWKAEDDDVLSIIESRDFEMDVSRDEIRSEVGRELAKREQNNASGVDALNQTDRATPSILAAPESWRSECPQSPYQCGLIPYWELGVPSSLPIFALDLCSPPKGEEDFDGWLTEHGPSFLRPGANVEDTGMDFFDEGTELA